MRIRKSFKILLICIVLFAICDCAFLFMLPVSLTPQVQEYLIKKLVSFTTTAQIDLSMRPIKTYSDFSIEGGAQYLILRDESSQIIFSGNDIDLKASALPLIFKKISVSNFNLKKLQLNIVRFSDGKYNIEKIFKKPKSLNSLFTFSKLFCNIEDYDINFIDELNDKKIVLEGDYFKINNFINNKFIDIDTSGMILTAETHQTPFNIKFATTLPLSLNPDLDKTVIEGYFENLSLEYFKPYLQEYIADDIVDASGDMSFEFHTNKNTEKPTEKQFLIKGSIDNLLFDKTSMQGKMVSDSRININISLGYDERKLMVNNLNINSDDYEIKTNGSIQFFEDKSPLLGLNITVPNAKADAIKDVIPTNIIPKDSEHVDIIKRIKKYELFGDIKGNMSVQGYIPTPNLTGTIKANNVHLFSENDKTHKASVDLQFQGNTMKLDVGVNMSDGESAKISGLTYLFNDGLNHFDIVTSNNVDFPLAQKIVLPVQDVLKFELGPIPMMPIKSGKGQIDIKIDGTKYEGSLFGKAVFKDGITGYSGLSGLAEDAHGEVSFNDKDVLYNVDGYLAGYPININGKAVQNGIVEINVGSDAIETAEIIKLINDSPLLLEVKQGLSALKNISGMSKINFTMRGNAEDFKTAENIKIRGTVYLFNDKCNISGFNTPLHSAKGIVEFSEKDVVFKDLSAMIESSAINISGNILINRETKIPTIALSVTGKEINAGDTIKFLAESEMNRAALPDISNLYALKSQHDLLFEYNAQSSEFDVKNAVATLNFIKNPQLNSPVKINSGKIILKNNKVFIDEIIADFFNTKAVAQGTVEKINTSSPAYNLDIDIDNFDFASFPEIKNLSVISDASKSFFAMFDDFKGRADLDIKVKDNNMQGNIDVSQLTFKNKKTNIPVTIPKTNFEIKGNKLIAKSLKAKVGKTDIFGDVSLSEIGRTNIVTAHLGTKITKDFVDAYINPFLPSDVKVFGDIGLSAEVKGNIDDMKVNPKIIFSPESDLVYMGTHLGDTSLQREFQGIIEKISDKIYIKNFVYSRAKHNLASVNAEFIADTSKTLMNFITINTHENLPVRFLNPFIGHEFFKTGDFSANIKYYTDAETNIPKIQGSAECKNATATDLNFKIDNLKLKTEQDLINVNFNGNVASADLAISASLKNDLNFPIDIESLNISSPELNNTALIDSLNNVREVYLKNETRKKNEKKENQNFLNIHKGRINIDNLKYNNLNLENISANYTLDDENVFEVSDIKANISDGTINGNASYNFPTGEIKINTEFTDVDSNAIAENLFGAKNQLFGTGHGRLTVETIGETTEERIKNLNGEGFFVIIDGKMPKLGSLEYLLRASNIVKSGISGLTLNNMLDLLNFAKTGSFMSINGSFLLQNGIIKDINVYSQGTNLSLYLNGKYNILSEEANADIWGKLSNKLSTLLGPLGNTSLNSFFSMIPGISLMEGDIKEMNENIEKIPPLDYSNDDYKLFRAVIDGNINSNSSDYVKSFKWIE